MWFALAAVSGDAEAAKRRDLLVDRAYLFSFYDERLPEDIYTLRRLERWASKADRQNPGFLRMRREEIQLFSADGITPDRFPPVFQVGSLALPLAYRFAPGEDVQVNPQAALLRLRHGDLAADADVKAGGLGVKGGASRCLRDREEGEGLLAQGHGEDLPVVAASAGAVPAAEGLGVHAGQERAPVLRGRGRRLLPRRRGRFGANARVLAAALQATDEGRAAYHEGQADLLTPIVKAYCADQAFRIAELAIQVYGGAGYVEDHPVEQYLRDAKIFSIYEGTNHIQALDLVARKLQSRGGANLASFLSEIGEFVERHRARPGLAAEVGALGDAAGALQRAGGALIEFFTSGRLEQVTLVASPFLEVMAEVTLAHLLLDAAVVAEARRAEAEEEHHQEEVDFYRGKVMAAKFFVNFVLPGVHAKLAAIVGADRSALDIPDAGFSTAR